MVTLKPWTEGGYDVEGVSFMVLRFSLLGLDKPKFDALSSVLRASQVARTRAQSTALISRAKARLDAKLSKDKRYINLYGGGAGDRAFSTLMLELTEAGLSSFASIVDGPMLLATAGADRLPRT